MDHDYNNHGHNGHELKGSNLHFNTRSLVKSRLHGVVKLISLFVYLSAI